MKKIAIVFHSVTGTTEQLATAIAQGVESVKNTQTQHISINNNDIISGRYTNEEIIDSLDDADAIIFGSPTFMGCVSAQFKAFADASSEKWTTQCWANKLAAGFTIGANLNGDQLNTLQYLQIFANQHGMLWVSLNIAGGYDALQRNRLGAQSGLIAHSADGTIDETDLLTAYYLGKRVATLL